MMLLGKYLVVLELVEFVLFYQPKLDLQTRRVTGVEALVRWRHPEQGLLYPSTFIPLIEQTALVGPLTLHVIDEALKQMVRWSRRGIALGVSVNLSARNLLDADLAGKITYLLARHQSPAARLTVEFT